MKNFSRLYIGLLLLFLALPVSAQECCDVKRYRPTVTVLAGLNVVDDSFTNNYNPFDVETQWTYGYYVGLEVKLIDNIYLQGIYATNHYRPGTIVNSEPNRRESEFISYDLYLIYNYGDLFNFNEKFEPYLIAGIGRTYIDFLTSLLPDPSASETFRTSYNVGAGFRYWFGYTENFRFPSFFDRLGVSFQGLGKISENIDLYGKQMQYSVGLMYKF